MTSTPESDPRNAWEVAELAHITTGQTMSPDEQTGDEWTVERTNEHYPAARVITTYAVVKRPTDEAGNWLDTSEIADEDAHPFWRYAVEEETEFVVTTTPDDFWAGGTDVIGAQRGEGSFMDYDNEEAADACAKSMAEHDAAISGAITWDGESAVV